MKTGRDAEERRVLIAEEGVKTYTGHWTPYSLCIAEGFAQWGWAPTVAGHREAEPGLLGEVPLAPVFRYSRWDGTYEHRPWIERRLLVFLHNRRLYRDMSAFLEGSAPFDLVFCGNIIVYHGLAWYWLMRKYQATRIRHLVLMMVQPAGRYDEPARRYRFPPRAWLLARSLRKAHDLTKVSLAVETPAAREEFAQLTRRPVALMHHPVETPPGWNPGRVPRREMLRIACPGFARYEKGSDVLIEAIRWLREGPKTLPRMRFVLQWRADGAFALPDGSMVSRDEDLREAGLVEYLEEPLSGVAYWNFLADCDLLVLPYRRYPYTQRLSRVAIEAMLCGRPVVYPAHSWLEYAIGQHGAGQPFTDGDPASLGQAIHRAAKELPALRQAAESRRPAAVEHFGARSFADKLLQVSGLTSH